MVEPNFKFGGPIEPKLFYNREKEVKFLLNQLSEIKKGVQHNYALVGPRRTGKSSILQFLQTEIRKKKAIIPVIVDCEGREIAEHLELTLETFLEAYSGAVIDAYITYAKIGDKIKIRLKELVMGAKDKIIAGLAEALGSTKALELKTLSDYLTLRVEFEKLTSKPSEKEVIRFFEDTISLPEKLGKEKNVFFVMMLDEFQYTAKFIRPVHFLPAFRRHVQKQKRVAYMLSGSSIGMMEDILQGIPFGGHIPIEWINSFDNVIAKKFLKDRFKKARRTINDDNIEKIVNITNSHPAYLNWFGEQCCRETVKGEKIIHELIVELEKKIFEREGLRHIFEGDIAKISPRKGKILQTFIEMAGHDLSSPTEISKHIPRTKPSEVIIYLKRLEKKGFVKKQKKGDYKIVDQMLKKYVKEKIHTTP